MKNAHVRPENREKNGKTFFTNKDDGGVEENLKEKRTEQKLHRARFGDGALYAVVAAVACIFYNCIECSRRLSGWPQNQNEARAQR